jgi:hypothetical protein
MVIVVFGAMTIANVSRAVMAIAVAVVSITTLVALVSGSLLMMFTNPALSYVNIA